MYSQSKHICEFQNKLNTFCKKKAEVTAEFDMSPFASEIHYSESVTTKDMLQWIPDLLVEKKVLNNRYRNSVFDQVSTKLCHAITYNAFGKGPGASIDHFFVRGDIEVKQYRILDGDYGVPYISDHYPIEMVIRL
jgi:hypothetical protein